MFTNIADPYTKKKFPLSSSRGLNILEKYLSILRKTSVTTAPSGVPSEELFGPNLNPDDNKALQITPSGVPSKEIFGPTVDQYGGAASSERDPLPPGYGLRRREARPDSFLGGDDEWVGTDWSAPIRRREGLPAVELGEEETEEGGDGIGGDGAAERAWRVGRPMPIIFPEEGHRAMARRSATPPARVSPPPAPRPSPSGPPPASIPSPSGPPSAPIPSPRGPPSAPIPSPSGPPPAPIPSPRGPPPARLYRGQRAIPTPVPTTTATSPPSITINLSRRLVTTTPVKPNELYLETFFENPKTPSCTSSQLKELNILIGTLNNYILAGGVAGSHEKTLNTLKKDKTKLKDKPQTIFITKLVSTYNDGSHPKLVVANKEFMAATKNMKSQKATRLQLTTDISDLDEKLKMKRGLATSTATDSDYENLARLRLDLKKNNGNDEKTQLVEARKKLIEELIMRVDASIVSTTKKKKKEMKQIYITGTDHKCITATNKLEIKNLVLKYGDSVKDSHADEITIDISSHPRNPYTLNITIKRPDGSSYSKFPTTIEIMVPKSIFILDLTNLIGVGDSTLDFIKSKFDDSNNNDTYYTRFIEYILSFADDMRVGPINKTIIYKDLPTSPRFKIIGLLDDTYHINTVTGEKHNILVTAKNFMNFDEDDDEDVITVDLNMATIPWDLSKIDINADNITITDYSKDGTGHKKYGKLNFYSGENKIVENSILDLASPSWC